MSTTIFLILCTLNKFPYNIMMVKVRVRLTVGLGKVMSDMTYVSNH